MLAVTIEEELAVERFEVEVYETVAEALEDEEMEVADDGEEELVASTALVELVGTSIRM